MNWRKLGPTPEANRRFTPQGLTFADGGLLLTVGMDDKKGVVYVPRTGGNGYLVDDGFDLPPEAVHTSGLTWDGRSPWAIDHVSRTLYRIDLETSLMTGKAVVTGAVETGLRGSGSVGDVRDKARYSYRNGFIVQWITWDGKYIYEANNNLGTDSIFRINARKAIAGGSFRDGIVSVFSAPGTMIEDLATDGVHVRTSDEKTFELYETLDILRK